MRSKSDASPAASSPRGATLAEAVGLCRGNRRLLAETAEILRKAEAELAGRAVCLGGGVCCRFDLAGHRLMVSTAELALLCLVPPPTPPRELRCPYQAAARCTARDRRPLGCRAYFCDPGARRASHEVYERHHARLRRLHERHGAPYYYAELTAGVAEVAVAGVFALTPPLSASRIPGDTVSSSIDLCRAGDIRHGCRGGGRT